MSTLLRGDDRENVTNIADFRTEHLLSNNMLVFDRNGHKVVNMSIKKK